MTAQMRPEDVPGEWVKLSLDAYWDSEGGTPEGVRAVIAAVAPLIAAQERERIRLLILQECGDDYVAAKIIAAIRARGEKP